jgi:hypothetical protein
MFLCEKIYTPLDSFFNERRQFSFFGFGFETDKNEDKAKVTVSGLEMYHCRIIRIVELKKHVEG